MEDLKGRSVTGITDLTKEEIEMILDVSRQLKLELKTGRPHRILEGKSLAGIFETPSTRTSISFEVAMTQMGGHMLWLDQNRLWVGEAAEEDWHDTIKTIDRYADGIAYRAIRRERRNHETPDESVCRPGGGADGRDRAGSPGPARGGTRLGAFGRRKQPARPLARQCRPLPPA